MKALVDKVFPRICYSPTNNLRIGEKNQNMDIKDVFNIECQQPDFY